MLPDAGDKFKTKSSKMLNKTLTEAFLVKHQYIENRKADELVEYLHWVPGSGGDIWFIQNSDGKVAAYLYRELECVRDDR